jgi:hypothetical protein
VGETRIELAWDSRPTAFQVRRVYRFHHSPLNRLERGMSPSEWCSPRLLVIVLWDPTGKYGVEKLMKQRLTFLVFTVGLFCAVSASAAQNYAPYYTDETAVENQLETAGVTFKARHINIDAASCIGLRRYGVIPARGGYSDLFHRFSCITAGPNNATHTIQVSITYGPKRGKGYMHVLTVGA